MLSLHEPQFDETDERFVLDALRSGWVSTGGPYVDRFEREFADFVGMKHAVSVANGTLGLQLALETLRRLRDLEGPFEVLVPTLSFIATGNAVVHAGGRPVFVDCGTESFCIRPATVAEAIDGHFVRDSAGGWRSKTSGLPLLAVMPAHLMGWACDMEGIQRVAAERGVPVVEDAAEALGCREPDGRHVGSRSVAAVFSFNGNKILTTGGGGMIVTNDPAYANRAKHLGTTAKTDGVRFVHDEVGYNYRLVNLLAALGCSQLAKLPARLARKRVIFDLYKSEVASVPGVSIHAEAGGASNYWLVNARFATKTVREAALKLLMDNGVQVRPLWQPMHRQPAFVDYPQRETAFPNADFFWDSSLSLPSSPQLRDDDVRAVAALISRACAKGRS